ncbi:MAG: hypothetical protein EXR71_01315 [Myxococcales bacterium]|nr:hypothetical protein [Myxococcales bacterium]
MRRRERNPVGANIDLTPVLSTIVHLIPIVLIAVRFVTMVQQPVDARPLHAAEAPSREILDVQERDRVVIRVLASGFRVVGAGASETLLPCRAPCAPADYDYLALSDAMVSARVQHPAQTKVVVAPDAAVPYETLMGVFDAVTLRREGDSVRTLFAQPVLVNGVEQRVAPG